MATAKIFWSGHSQAVRLPKDYRFPPEVREVTVSREGGKLILEPEQPMQWPAEFWESLGALSEDFERPPQHLQNREDLEP